MATAVPTVVLLILATQSKMMSKPKSPLLLPYVECGGIREYLTYVGGHAVWTKGVEAQQMTFYHSFPIREALPLKWEEAVEFKDTLVLVDTERGRSAARLVVCSVTTNNRYQMFFADFVDMVAKVNLLKGVFTGRFIGIKKGANYAIKWVGDYQMYLYSL
jgi:hypothetical protein